MLCIDYIVYRQIQSPSSDRVGWIDVECWNATLKTSKKTVRNKQHNFTPGSKKDSLRVTQGQDRSICCAV